MATSTIPNSNQLIGTADIFNIESVSGAGFDAVYEQSKTSSISIIRVVNTQLEYPFSSNNFFGIQWKNGSGAYGTQVVFGMSGNNQMAVRTRSNNTWGSWRVI